MGRFGFLKNDEAKINRNGPDFSKYFLLKWALLGASFKVIINN